MLSDFVRANLAEISTRCRARGGKRTMSRAVETESGIPAFLVQLAEALRTIPVTATPEIGPAAAKHGADMLRRGYTIDELVHDYGDVCQSITQLAGERDFTIATPEFEALNFCLDEAIAQAVAEFGRHREQAVEHTGTDRATREMGFFAHELRNLLATALLAYEVLRGGSVGIGGSTGTVLGRSLTSLSRLVDRSLVTIRLDAGIAVRTPIAVGELVEEAQTAALLEAHAHGHKLVLVLGDAGVVVDADREILMSVVANLVQNALKFTRAHSNVILRTVASPGHVVIEVEDQCGGLSPGAAASLFEPYKQSHRDRTGLGLGLAICKRGVEAIGGRITVRDMPGKGCVFVIDLPVTALASA